MTQGCITQPSPGKFNITPTIGQCAENEILWSTQNYMSLALIYEKAEQL